MIDYKIKSEEELLELAYSMGNPMASRRSGVLIDNLIPVEKSHAHPQSLSAKFGVTEFPYHTDGAYFLTPPRFIILRYIKGVKKPTPTNVCDLSAMDYRMKETLQNSIWKVQAQSPFYSSILSHDGEYLRFDTCVMKPINRRNDAHLTFSALVSNSPIQEIEWEMNKTVIINNWRCLHMRPTVHKDEINFRTIQRIMVL